jgi:hypothetical protein
MPDQVTITEERQVLLLPDGVQTLSLLEESVALLEVAAQGPPGPPGGVVAGTGDLNYVHRQDVAAAVWPVVHNLGKHPSVTVVDSAGTWVIGDVTYTSLNTLTVTFGASFAGTCYLN